MGYLYIEDADEVNYYKILVDKHIRQQFGDNQFSDGLMEAFITEVSRKYDSPDYTHNQNDYPDARDGSEFGYVVPYKDKFYYFQFEYNSWDCHYLTDITECVIEQRTINVVRKIQVGTI